MPRRTTVPEIGGTSFVSRSRSAAIEACDAATWLAASNSA